MHTIEKQQRLLTAHEYTGEVASIRHLQDCGSCGHRTEFTCVKCAYCYSSHWKREQIEETKLRDKLKDLIIIAIKRQAKKTRVQKEDKVKDQEFGKWGTLDVLGQPAEPICNYYAWHHKFSLHGSRRCKCKHPTNKVL